MAPVEAAPRLPPLAGYLWGIWNELHAARSCGMAPNPISWHEIDAYQRVVGHWLEPWEARAIRAVDDAYIASRANDIAGGD